MKYKSEKNFPFFIYLLFLFPLFKESILTVLIILLGINTIVYIYQKKNIKAFKKEILILTLPFWIILISSLINYEDIKSLKPAGNALFFLVFPIVFNYIPSSNFTSDKIFKYLTLLKNVCLLIIISYIFAFFYKYTIYDFFIVSNNISKFRDFIYNEITFFKIHPNYFTTIIIFCTAFSLKSLLDNKKWSELIYIFFFVLITFLLIAKISILLIVALIIYFILFKIKGYKIQKLVFVILFLGILSFLAKNTPGINERFYEFSDSLTKPPVGLSYNSTNIRVAIYSCDYQLAIDNFWIGTGYDNIKNEIENCLNSKYSSDFYKHHQYLSHNYFLYILISGGIFSLAIFLSYLYFIFRKIININLFILYVFFLNILVISMIEDFFYRAFGLFFFNLIFLIFYKNNLIEKERL